MDTKALLYGGITVPCKLRTGEDVSVKLRLIKISEIPKYLDVALDEAAALKFCTESVTRKVTDEKGERIDPITVEPDDYDDASYLELVAKNHDLNFTRALAMSDQRLKQAEKTGAGIAQVAASLASVLSRYSANSASPAASAANSS